jgi:hypothetical protein
MVSNWMQLVQPPYRVRRSLLVVVRSLRCSLRRGALLLLLLRHHRLQRRGVDAAAAAAIRPRHRRPRGAYTDFTFISHHLRL